MLLRTAKTSPFGRKVWICALRLKLMDRIALVEANFQNPEDPLHADNPLGKMPVLHTDNGDILYDSPVIVEYLDYLAGGSRLIPVASSERWSNLKMQALADGVMDAAALIVLEGRMRPKELWHDASVEFQRRKIIQGLRAAQNALPDPRIVQIGAIALACALGFLDRRGQYNWRETYPALVSWLDEFRAAAPEYDLTYMPPEPGYVSP